MDEVSQVWFADDASGSGKLRCVRKFWDELCNQGPKYGYFPNASKTWLVTKNEFLQDAKDVFVGTEVQIT